MSYLQKIFKENLEYTRSYQLRVHVAFEVIKGERVDNKQRVGEKCNRVIVKNDHNLLCMVYLTSKHEDLTEKDMMQMTADIKAKKVKLNLVSQGGVCKDKINLDLITEEERTKMDYPLFDRKFVSCERKKN